jgi:cell division protein ZapA (FtsZ GTPase activity inhibitor)
MELIKKSMPLALFCVFSAKLLINNSFSINEVLVLAIFAGLMVLAEYKLESKKLKELSDKIEKYEKELEPLKSRVSSLQMIKSNNIK